MELPDSEDELALQALGLASPSSSSRSNSGVGKVRGALQRAIGAAGSRHASFAGVVDGVVQRKSGNASPAKVTSERLNIVKAAVATDDLRAFTAAINEVFVGVPYTVVHSIPFNAEGWCLPHIAASNNAFSVLQWCFENGANMDMRTKDNGWTPMHFAAFNATERCCAFLRHVRANQNIEDFYGDKPCDIANMVGQPHIAELLGDDSAARAAKEREEAEYQQVLREARALEDAREAEEERKRQAAREEDERKARRSERLERQRRLKALFEGERLALVSRWLQQRQNIEREQVQMMEWLSYSLVFGAEQLDKVLIDLAADQRRAAAAAAATAAAGASGPDGGGADDGTAGKGGGGRRKSRRSSSLSPAAGTKTTKPPKSGKGRGKAKSDASPDAGAQPAGLSPANRSVSFAALARNASFALSSGSFASGSTQSPTVMMPASPPAALAAAAMSPAERQAAVDAAVALIAGGADFSAIANPYVFLSPDDVDAEVVLPAPRGSMTKKKKQDLAKVRGLLERERRARIALRDRLSEEFRHQCVAEQDALQRGEAEARREVAAAWFLALGALAQRDPTSDRRHSGAFVWKQQLGGSSPEGGDDRFAKYDSSSAVFGSPARASTRSLLQLKREGGGGSSGGSGGGTSLGLFGDVRDERSGSDDSDSDERSDIVRATAALLAQDPNASAAEVAARWSCCGQHDFIAMGCDAVEDTLRPPYHAGTYKYHLPHCTCGKLSTSGTGIVYCSPGNFIWSCCGAAAHDSDGCAYHRRFLYAPNSYVDQRFTETPERAMEVVVEAIAEAMGGGGSSGADASLSFSHGPSLEHTLTLRDASTSDRRRPSIATNTLAGTLPNVTMSEAFAATAGEGSVRGARGWQKQQTAHQQHSSAGRRRSTVVALAAAGGSKRSSVAGSLSATTLDAVTRGAFPQPFVFRHTFSIFSTQWLQVSDSGQTVSHALRSNPGNLITRTNVFGHCPMDCSRHDDNVYCFSIVVDACPVPKSPTDERLVIGVVLADLDEADRQRKPQRQGTDVVGSEEEGGIDEAGAAAGQSFRRAGSVRRTRSEMAAGLRTAARKNLDVVAHDVGMGERVESGDLSPAKLAAERLRAAQKAEEAANPSAAPRTIRDALAGKFISGPLGLGWWAHSREIRGLGVEAEASAVYREGDTVTVVVDGTNNFVSFFLNRDLVAQVMVDARRVFRPAVTLVAGCTVTSEASYKRSSLQFVEQYMREKATAERLFRLRNAGLATAFSEYSAVYRTSGLRQYRATAKAAPTAAQELLRQLSSSNGGSAANGSERVKSAEDEEEEAARILFD